MVITDEDVEKFYNKLVKVEWEDIVAWGGWVEADNFPSEGQEPAKCVSYGSLTRITESHITVSGTRSGNDWNQHITIPLGVVTKLELLTVIE